MLEENEVNIHRAPLEAFHEWYAAEEVEEV
jgi:hypothetical protein